jgi:hypothetical protein
MIKYIFIYIILFFSFSIQNIEAENKSDRCEAITKKGIRCKNKVVKNTKFCHLHQVKSSSVQQCKAKTKSGTRCSRESKKSGYCTQHYKIYIEGKK